MINNRQAGRRNRGRNNNNNGRPNNQSRGGGDTGNRIDNRARGNATQLLEKYRNLARDAQLAGDRVNTEYYLQFADHYFRVLADNRARQEEAQGGQQQPRPRPEPSYDEFGDEYDTGDVTNGGVDYDDRSQQTQAPRDNGREANRDNGYRDNGNREARQPYQNRDDGRGGEGRGNEGRGNEGRRNDYRNEGRNEPRNDYRGDNRNDGRNESRGEPRSDNREEGRRERQPLRRDGQRRDAPVAAAPGAPIVQDVPVQEAPAPVAIAAEVPVEAPRRRGRPPKAREAVAEAVTQEAAPAAPVETAEDTPASRRSLRQRRPREETSENGTLDLAVLPPAIARTEADNDSVAEEAPRKRTRRARPSAEAAE